MGWSMWRWLTSRIKPRREGEEGWTANQRERVLLAWVLGASSLLSLPRTFLPTSPSSPFS